MPEKFCFYLAGSKGLFVLEEFLKKHEPASVLKVVSARDENMENDHYDDIQDLCSKNGIKFSDRSFDKGPGDGWTFAVSWKWILPSDGKLVILHDSLLPAYRGFAPLVNALIHGEKKTGVTAIIANAEFDKGDIIGQLSVSLKYPLTIARAIQLIEPLYASLVNSVSEKIISGKKLIRKKQDEKKASYSLWRDDLDYHIDWKRSSAEIKRFIDAVGSPYLGAAAVLHERKIRILEAETVPDVRIVNRDCGKVIFINDGNPVVVCGKGLIRITRAVDESGHSVLPVKKFRTRFE